MGENDRLVNESMHGKFGSKREGGDLKRRKQDGEPWRTSDYLGEGAEYDMASLSRTEFDQKYGLGASGTPRIESIDYAGDMSVPDEELAKIRKVLESRWSSFEQRDIAKLDAVEDDSLITVSDVRTVRLALERFIAAKRTGEDEMANAAKNEIDVVNRRVSGRS